MHCTLYVCYVMFLIMVLLYCIILVQIGNSHKEDRALRKHVLVEAIDLACSPLQVMLAHTTNEEEIRTIKMDIRKLRYMCGTLPLQAIGCTPT